MAGFCRDTGSLEFRPQFVPAPSTACLYQRVETSRVPHLFIPPATTDICQVQKHDNTDLHNRVFLTSMSQNASRFVIFSMTNFYIRRRKVSRAFFFISHVAVMSHYPWIFHWWLGQCGSSSDWGKKKIEAVPTMINLLDSWNFRLSSHSHLPSPFTTRVDHQ